MRRTLLVHTAVLPLFLILAAVSQTSGSARQDTPDALNAQYKQAMQASDWTSAVTAAQQMVNLSASAENLYLLANAQLNAGSAQKDSAAITASLTTYDRALAMAKTEKPAEGQPDAAWKDSTAKIFIGKGNGLLRLNRSDEAIDAYNQGAELAANPGPAYFNICAVAYNAGKTQEATAACRKCLEADPTKADGWFILGSVLFVGATSDASGKFVISADTRQALEKYLQLAPNGPHAADVKEMLNAAAN